MRGVAVLYLESQRVVILREVDEKVVEEIKKQCGGNNCICHIDNREVDFGSVQHVIWMDHADIGEERYPIFLPSSGLALIIS